MNDTKIKDNAQLLNILWILSDELKFEKVVLEEDFYITLLFKELEKIKNNNLVFKWWTCLNKVYFWYYRLSEDIDFSVQAEKSIISMSKKERSNRLTEIHNILDDCFWKIWFKEDRERNINKDWEYRCKHSNATMMRLYYNKESVIEWQWTIVIQVEVSMRKNPYQPQLLKVNHLFFDKDWFDLINNWKDIKTNVYNINEVISEKLRCTYWRLWKRDWEVITKVAIRDYFDIYYFLNLYLINKENFENKFWFKWFDNETFMDLFLYKNLQDYKEKHISKDVSFKEERKYLKDEVLFAKEELSVVLKNWEYKEFFENWIDTTLDFIEWMQRNLKDYINKKYKLNFKEEQHLDEYLKALYDMNVKVIIE